MNRVFLKYNAINIKFLRSNKRCNIVEEKCPTISEPKPKIAQSSKNANSAISTSN